MRKPLVIVLVIAILAALGWFAMRQPAPEAPLDGPPPVTEPAPDAPTPVTEPAPPPMNAPRPVPIEPVSMEELQRIEPGLGCSFHQDKLMFLAINRSQAIFKGPEGIVTGPLDGATAEKLMQKGGSFKLGRYTVSVTTSGDMKQSGYETQSAPAVLKISDGPRTATIDGNWDCGA